ncbi:MAG: TatD family hydrolase [Candidatus Anstonellales archaeon]
MNFSFSDSHIHIYERPFEIDYRCLYLVPTYSFESISKSLTFKSRFGNLSNIKYAIGIAPQELIFGNFNLHDLEKLSHYIESKKQEFNAIGEIGLDLHYGKTEDLPKMLKLFEEQLRLAEKFRFPVIIHSRKAEHLIYDIVKSYNVKGIMHAFGGTLEEAKKLVDLGYIISIPPIKSKERKKIIKEIEIESLLVETDYPFIAKDHQEIFNSIKIVSEYKDISEEEVMALTLRNLIKLLI